MSGSTDRAVVETRVLFSGNTIFLSEIDLLNRDEHTMLKKNPKQRKNCVVLRKKISCHVGQKNTKHSSGMMNAN